KTINDKDWYVSATTTKTDTYQIVNNQAIKVKDVEISIIHNVTVVYTDTKATQARDYESRDAEYDPVISQWVNVIDAKSGYSLNFITSFSTKTTTYKYDGTTLLSSETKTKSNTFSYYALSNETGRLCANENDLIAAVSKKTKMPGVQGKEYNNHPVSWDSATYGDGTISKSKVINGRLSVVEIISQTFIPGTEDSESILSGSIQKYNYDKYGYLTGVTGTEFSIKFKDNNTNGSFDKGDELVEWTKGLNISGLTYSNNSKRYTSLTAFKISDINWTGISGSSSSKYVIINGQAKLIYSKEYTVRYEKDVGATKDNNTILNLKETFYQYDENANSISKQVRIYSNKYLGHLTSFPADVIRISGPPATLANLKGIWERNPGFDLISITTQKENHKNIGGKLTLNSTEFNSYEVSKEKVLNQSRVNGAAEGTQIHIAMDGTVTGVNDSTYLDPEDLNQYNANDIKTKYYLSEYYSKDVYNYSDKGILLSVDSTKTSDSYSFLAEAGQGVTGFSILTNSTGYPAEFRLIGGSGFIVPKFSQNQAVGTRTLDNHKIIVSTNCVVRGQKLELKEESQNYSFNLSSVYNYVVNDNTTINIVKYVYNTKDFSESKQTQTAITYGAMKTMMNQYDANNGTQWNKYLKDNGYVNNESQRGNLQIVYGYEFANGARATSYLVDKATCSYKREITYKFYNEDLSIRGGWGQVLLNFIYEAKVDSSTLKVLPASTEKIL
ncbi:MAG: hypothetical protein ACD_79C00792G0001, partial [uncultured bacterium]